MPPQSRSRSAPRSLLHPHPVQLLSLLWQQPSLPRARPSPPAACPHLFACSALSPLRGSRPPSRALA
eukprot:4585133-Prymnesium_polylepis.1